jgi:hypothetical protein
MQTLAAPIDTLDQNTRNALLEMEANGDVQGLIEVLMYTQMVEALVTDVYDTRGKMVYEGKLLFTMRQLDRIGFLAKAYQEIASLFDSTAMTYNELADAKAKLLQIRPKTRALAQVVRDILLYTRGFGYTVVMDNWTGKQPVRTAEEVEDQPVLARTWTVSDPKGVINVRMSDMTLYQIGVYAKDAQARLQKSGFGEIVISTGVVIFLIVAILVAYVMNQLINWWSRPSTEKIDGILEGRAKKAVESGDPEKEKQAVNDLLEWNKFKQENHQESTEPGMGLLMWIVLGGIGLMVVGPMLGGMFGGTRVR